VGALKKIDFYSFSVFIFDPPPPVPLSSILLKKLINELKLTPIGSPFVVGFGQKAYSIFQAIGQSFIVMETWPEFPLIRIIIDSCSPLKEEDVKQAIKRTFETEDIEIYATPFTLQK